MSVEQARPELARRELARRELARVVELLRTMPLARLEGERAARARSLAQALADAAADLEGRPRRVVPDVGPTAVGDQVAVTGADLLALDPPQGVLADAEAGLIAVRRSL